VSPADLAALWTHENLRQAADNIRKSITRPIVLEDPFESGIPEEYPIRMREEPAPSCVAGHDHVNADDYTGNVFCSRCGEQQ
jgi:hypothetical protein